MLSKQYGECACAEAMYDIEMMMLALQRLLSSTHDVDFQTASVDSDDVVEVLSTSVRQLVTDSKNLVAGATMSASDLEAKLRVLIEIVMHTLATVFIQCCQLVAIDRSSSPPDSAVADVADNVMDTARSLRTTLEASSAVLESTDANETEQCKNSVLSMAASLAKSLIALVNKVKTI